MLLARTSVRYQPDRKGGSLAVVRPSRAAEAVFEVTPVPAWYMCWYRGPGSRVRHAVLNMFHGRRVSEC